MTELKETNKQRQENLWDHNSDEIGLFRLRGNKNMACEQRERIFGLQLLCNNNNREMKKKNTNERISFLTWSYVFSLRELENRLLAIDDSNLSVCVKRSHVARVQPSVAVNRLGRFGGIAKIAFFLKNKKLNNQQKRTEREKKTTPLNMLGPRAHNSPLFFAAKKPKSGSDTSFTSLLKIEIQKVLTMNLFAKRFANQMIGCPTCPTVGSSSALQEMPAVDSV